MLRAAFAEIAAVLFSFSIAAQADSPAYLPKYVDGNGFYESCRLDATAAVCIAYVKGASDAFSAASILLNACLYAPPPNASADQLSDILVKYLREHPERRALGAASLFLAAMRETFPCP